MILSLMNGEPIKFALKGNVEKGDLHLTMAGRDLYSARVTFPSSNQGLTWDVKEIELSQQQFDTIKWNSAEQTFTGEF